MINKQQHFRIKPLPVVISKPPASSGTQGTRQVSVTAPKAQLWRWFMDWQHTTHHSGLQQEKLETRSQLPSYWFLLGIVCFSFLQIYLDETVLPLLTAIGSYDRSHCTQSPIDLLKHVTANTHSCCPPNFSHFAGGGLIPLSRSVFAS